jgi:hypothetical protein
MLCGFLFLPSSAFGPVGGLCLIFGLIMVLLHRLLGGLDFRISSFVPNRMSRWWGDATTDTAKRWWLYLGMISLGTGCVYLRAAIVAPHI